MRHCSASKGDREVIVHEEAGARDAVRPSVLNEFLLRFREAAVPGASAGAGAPADPTAALEAELAPVFALLEESERAADALEAEALREARRRRVEASEQARLLVVEARSQAAGARAAELAARISQASEICAAIHARGAAESLRIDAALQQRVTPLVARLVERILGGAEAVTTR